jgi:hypothetical protein
MDIWYTAMGLYNTQRLQSKLTKAPWYVSNFTIHNDLQIPFVMEEIHNCQQVTIKAYSDTITGRN